jgi:hypothetical protein
MKTKTLYKVTKQGRSWNSWTPAVRLNYSVGNTTVPSFGKILTFEKYQHVLDFVMTNSGSYRDIIVFEGVGENPHGIKLLVIEAYLNGKKFWKAKKEKKGVKNLCTFYAPKGTIAVDNFTPTKQYTFEEFKNLPEGYKNVKKTC